MSDLAGDRRGAGASDLPARLTSGFALAAMALAAAWFGSWVAVVVVGVLAVLVMWEWAGLVAAERMRLAAFFAPVLVAFALLELGFGPLAMVVAGVTIIASVFLAKPRMWGAVGVAYSSAFGLSLLALRLPTVDGLAAILFVFAVVWSTDIAAYFAGRAFGGPKLWPAVSPSKTWSGAVGGLVAGASAGLAVAWLAGASPGVMLVMVSVLLSLASQLGDLFESSVKRRFGAKDSGRIIPGHGGIMDRVDGLIFAASAAALIGWMHAPDSPASGLLQW